jgi:hypothetical protein
MKNLSLIKKSATPEGSINQNIWKFEVLHLTSH